MPSTALVFAASFVFWFLLAGHFAPIDIAMAILGSALVARVNRDQERLSGVFRQAGPLLLYAPWLAREIWRANLQVLRIVLHPRLPIDPVVVRLRTSFTSQLATTTLANSITLTPGTVTLDVEGDELVVHALTAAAAVDLLAGGMARRVGAVFGDPGAA
jgi:multicomponent Na+:H+ antiporter subunit E